MTQLRTALLALAAAASLTGGTVLAMPLEPGERAKAFATCLGRYAAAVRYAPVTGDDAEDAAARRDLFADLLEAATPGAGIRPPQLSRYRLGAKNAQARLIRMAQGTGDLRRARTAASIARRQIGMCDALILG